VQSKNKPSMTVLERVFVTLVKQLPCSVCDQPGPSEAHEVKQGQWWTSIALCIGCHRGPLNGLHGQRRMWMVKKMEEIDALAVTIRRLFEKLIGRPGT
jgi:hypothetical protein